MRLVWILVFLTLSFVVPFLIWGSAFEDAFPRDGEWLKEWGRWAWLIAIILLIFDLLLPIHQNFYYKDLLNQKDIPHFL